MLSEKISSMSECKFKRDTILEEQNVIINNVQVAGKSISYSQY